MKRFTCEDSVDDLIDAVLEGKSDEEKIRVLRNALSNTMTHGWVDEGLRDSLMQNFANEHDIPYKSMEDEDEHSEDD